MNAIYQRIITAIVFLIYIVIGFSACNIETPQVSGFNVNLIKSYQEIPGVTKEEIEAIEALKTSRAAFTYVVMPSTEAFMLPDGTNAGFSLMFTDLLSELFGIPFNIQLHGWTELKNGIDDKSIDFTGEMTPTLERRLVYYMSYPIAERGMAVFSRDDVLQIKLDDLKGLRIGFYKGTITAQSILAAYPELVFEIVDVFDDLDVKEKLSSGVIDVFIDEAKSAIAYIDGFNTHNNILPLIYTPVSLTTANSELEPIITVVNKYIAAGGIDLLYSFYLEGNLEYARFNFYNSLTNAERAYIDNLSKTGEKIPIAFESDNYPISFYNENDRQFQGIAIDVLEDISLLTGIEFQNTSARNEAWGQILEKLTQGDVALVTELLFTEERKDRFLWPEHSHAVNRYALISKSDFPYLEAFQVVRATVGVMRMTGREDTFRAIFPNTDNLKLYDYQSEVFDALERDEIDLVMSTEYDFLTLINYLERPGYKLNIVFNSPLVESYFGFNINEVILRSIINKSLRNIDTARIERDWVNRTFSYERIMANQRSYYANQLAIILAISSIILLMLIITLSILLRKNDKTSKLYKKEIEEKKLMEKAITASNERLMLMLDTSPLCAQLWDRNLYTIDCNEAAVRLYKFKDKQEYRDRFITSCSPEYQPDGHRSDKKAVMLVHKAFDEGYCKFDWMHKMPDEDILIPAEVTLVRGKYGSNDVVIGYTRDLREYNKMLDAIKYREKMLEVLNKTAIVFMTQHNKSFEDIMSTGLKLIIDELDLDRLSVWRNSVMLDGLHASQIFRWDKESGGTTEPTAELTDVLYTHLAPRWEALLAGGEVINSPVELLPEAAIFNRFGVVSAFVTPVFIDNSFWGFALFEDRRNKRYFDDNSADIMRSAAFMCANAVLRNQLIKKNQNDTAMLETALNKMSEAIELAEQSNRAKSIFLAQMSHEIRTPMNAILGISEILLQNSNSLADAEEGFRKIYESGSLLLNIINDILDFSKIEAGKLEIFPKKYDIPIFINDTVHINRVRYENKPIEFILELDENTPLEVIGDELRIRQVLNNLLSNAFKYTEAGKVKLYVTFEPGHDDETVNLIFILSDTGQGMNKDQLGRLFSEYERFNMETNHGISGTGLGLSITKHLVELMDGVISVESEVSKGTVFTVRIPQKKCNSFVCGKDIAEKLQNFKFRSMSHFKNEQILHDYMPNNRVLVVDDVASNLYVAKGLLLPYGLCIDTASNGIEAIEKIESDGNYDIVFMDHMMPKMNGLQAVKIIREMGYKRPIIALTANVISGQEEMFLSNGFDGFIAKPIDSRELDLILTNFIRDKEPLEIEKTAKQEQKNINTIEKIKYFILDAENALKVLKDFNFLNNNLNDEDIELFVTTVHGIKSALANINENKLSETALVLEKAGESRDFTVIKNEILLFINALQLLIDKFKSEEVNSNVEISSDDIVFLKEKLSNIVTESENFNIKAVKRQLADIKQKTWPRELSNIIDEISLNTLHGSFKKVITASQKALELL